jgi:signal transduction histidine kinase
MPIDYRRLVEGLAALTASSGDSPELVAIESMLATVRQATGAVGGTFTEYGIQGGRVAVAQGAMAWALGQPVPSELIEPDVVGQAFAGRADALPVEAAEQLLSRGIRALAGHPVRTGDRVVGALHLFFAELSDQDRTQVEQVLRLAAGCAGCSYTGRESPPIRSAEEEDDRSLFLAIAGHELRTPVTVIKGYASLVAGRWEALSEPERRSAVQVVSQRADDLAALVDRLLGVSAGDATSGAVRRIPFDLLDALVRAVAELPAELRRVVKVQLPNQLPLALGDPDALGTVVTELVTNAVKAGRQPVRSSAAEPRQDPARSPDRPHWSTVELAAGADSDTVFIRVEDRGTGIDAAHAEQAFERFWRGGAEGEVRSGVGLGLYLVRRLVERQNGWVSLRPRDGGGTVAEVRLSRADGPSGALTSKGSHHPARQAVAGGLLSGDSAGREA